MDQNDLDNRFMYHPPVTDDKKLAHEKVREFCRLLSLDLNELLPEGREKSLAITHLETVMFWANAAVARS